MTLYILNYNSYYNRLVKKEDSIEGYQAYIHYTQMNANFNPNDSINTQHIVGQGEYDGKGDYLIVYDNDIVSRWFIIDSTRTRAGQWQLTLHRDVIADYYNLIIESPVFIEKATLSKNNPLIFNNENMIFNQIKKNEYLLKDRTGCPWLVGYYSKNEALEGTVSVNKDSNLNYILLNISAIENWEFYPYNQGQEMVGPEISGTYEIRYQDGVNYNPTKRLAKVNKFTGDTILTIPTGSMAIQHSNSLLSIYEFKEVFSKNNLDTSSEINSVPKSTVDELLSFDGKTVKTLNGAYYSIQVGSYQKTVTKSVTAGSLFVNLWNLLKNELAMTGSPDGSTFKYTYTSNYYTLSIKELTSLETSYNISKNRVKTENAPWDIFAIPYGTITVKRPGESDIVTNEDIAINLAATINETHQSKVYDIQLVPYCPIQNLISDESQVTVSNATQYSIVSGPNNTAAGVIFNVPKSSFEFDITSITLPIAQTAVERKVNNECDKWRLASPNYSNYFDFSVEKNNGVQYFNVDCDYKPYTPYIHVNPNFNYMYGEDFNDPRGLVVGGDFSISQITDAWKQYQIQNKNFQLSFDRQIQNMEVNNSIQRIQERLGAGVGSVQGGLTGASTGAMLGGGLGAAIGGIGGTAASGVGGLADLRINEMLRNEVMDYTKDLFGYQLGNIQALPQTISKISSFNPNNKIFPVLEYYTATDEEKKAFRNKIKYNGMTVMVIDKIQNYVQVDEVSYIKGQLIRFTDSDEDYHLVNAIASELNKGAYFNGISV